MGKDVEAFLAHHGVLGMHWGIRKQENTPSLTPEQMQIINRQNSEKTKKRIALSVVGGAVALAGAAFVIKNRRIPLKLIKKTVATKKAKSFVANKLTEPVDIIHAARGKSVGFKFPKNGGVGDPLIQYDKAGFNNHPSGEFFEKFGDNSEKIAARFRDPLGRLDEANRPISHEVIIPKEMTSDIHSLDDVIAKIWPKIKDDYDVLYNKPRS